MSLESLKVKFGKKIPLETLMVSDEWLSKIDRIVADNLDTLTCHDLQRMYFAFFENMKRYRSNSAGFTGFSEFLVFRSLYHTIGEDFKPTSKEEKESIQTDPIIFRSTNYEIGQNVSTSRVGIKTGGGNLFPDIYVKKDGKLLSIVQIKIYLGGGIKQIEKESEIFNRLKKNNYGLKGRFIVFIKQGFYVKKREMLEEVNFNPVILENNTKLIFNTLKEII